MRFAKTIKYTLFLLAYKLKSYGQKAKFDLFETGYVL